MLKFNVVQTFAFCLLLGLGATMAVQAAERFTDGNTSARLGNNPGNQGRNHSDRLLGGGKIIDDVTPKRKLGGGKIIDDVTPKRKLGGGKIIDDVTPKRRLGGGKIIDDVSPK